MKILGAILAAIQFVLPHHLLTRLAWYASRARLAPVKNTLIVVIGGLVGVDWSESRHKQVSDFETFNDFFTRELTPGARPQNTDPKGFNSPCDGEISECGRFTGDRLVQVKGQHYGLGRLLANDSSTAAFRNGFFHTIYLAPHNYHRVHMPRDGKLERTIHVPGRLYSVSRWSVENVEGIFARNERVISIFSTDLGPMAIVMVGALMVGSMETVWAGRITPPRGRRVTVGEYAHHDIRLQKGDEMGRFNMGSTVILLQPPSAVSTLGDFGSGDPVIVGQVLGKLA